MPLKTFVLSDQSSTLPVGPLIEQSMRGGTEIRNADGKTIAFVLAADDEEAWTYAEASMDIMKHRDEILAAANRRTGVTTDVLLANVQRAGKIHDLSNALDVIRELCHEKLEELRSQGAGDDESQETPSHRKAKAG
jgi:hypothetical protein